MGAFLLRRLLWFVPTLLVVVLVAFALREATPGDPVETLYRAGGGEFYGDVRPEQVDRAYRQTARRYGLDRPAFYFSIATAAHPDTLYRYFRRPQRTVLESLLRRHGNWPAVESYYRELLAAQRALYELPADTPGLIERKRRTAALTETADPAALADFWAQPFADRPPFRGAQAAYRALLSAEAAGRYLPRLSWHGTDNRFHRYLSGVLRGDLGRSYRDGQPVGTRIRAALGWTLLLSIGSIALAFGIAVPLGVWSAARRGGRATQAVSLLLYALYSLPVFWVATLLLVFFTTPEYGLDWFNGQYRGSAAGAGFWTAVGGAAGFLVLPILCLTYRRLAYLFMQVRGGMQTVLRQPYILNARARGLSRRRILWRHAFPNAAFPLITIVANLFPRAVAGSVIVEYIFSLPGMGRLALQSIQSEDWPVVFGVLLLGAVLTLVGILISDVGYFLTDPRLRQPLAA